ncbi:splicing factor U2AF 50 kDa subunit [Drosophila sulfurigaster albostrigata]|uniref:splicing factor U2AF 50 kDa subunit n=1 Tax=Drosophila sulfurigaster albostrigata TaxID=89887 RepID=UPI002D21EC27|nr:splicing factor U2AF 50 kDa subunit [Drosophila sulfurigaster albostrigata]
MGRNREDRHHYHHSSRSQSCSKSYSYSKQSRGSSNSNGREVEKIRTRRSGKISGWDIPPMGYEHLTPIQYKVMQASGQIASRIVPDAPPTGESAAIATVTRQARRLYVGNIPFNTSEDEMMVFFNEKMQQLNVGAYLDGDAVLTCQTNLEKNFAFLEFRSMDEATMAISFDGINYRGQALKIRRPHDYHPVVSVSTVSFEAMLKGTQQTTNLAISAVVPDSPHKVYVGGLPTCLGDDQVKELLITFGQLRAFNLVKDSTGQSKGFAFCEYLDPTITEQAIAGLHGMQLGDRKLIVQRSLAGARSLASNQLPVLQVPGFPIENFASEATEILCLLNMVVPEELGDDEEYEDIRGDIKQECAKYGKVKSLKIPRPTGESGQGGCGKVFVRFETVEDCKKALNALSGRKFNGRIVMTSFFNPDKYKRREFQ